jgi:hypothetical protein
MNLYIVNGFCGGSCAFPQEGDNIIVIGGCSTDDGPLQLHEMGHYFSLYHTQGSTCSNCGSGPGQCNAPGDDEIADTLPDLECWDQDQIALNWTSEENPPRNYDALSAGEKVTVDNVFFNLMSYHGNKDRLTEQQLDRLTDTANSSRRGVTSGRTWFVDVNRGFFPPGDGSSILPFNSLGTGVAVANPNGGDVVLLRAGIYGEPQTITKSVTLRATRGGDVVIQ